MPNPGVTKCVLHELSCIKHKKEKNLSMLVHTNPGNLAKQAGDKSVDSQLLFYSLIHQLPTPSLFSRHRGRRTFSFPSFLLHTLTISWYIPSHSKLIVFSSIHSAK